MSVHIEAKKGDIAEIVLLPGDPLRAKYIAETFLENPVKYNTVRNMFGYTGTYNGKKVSVQGTGMGIPSAGIYIHELINEYGAKNLIRIGTCGALQEEMELRDIVIAQSASTDSSFIFKDMAPVYYAPTANFDLLHKAYTLSEEAGLNSVVGNIFTSDTFYSETDEINNRIAAHGVLCSEMETAALYYLAAKFGVKALSILTVSDHIITGEQTTSEERETTFNEMVKVALEAGTME